MSLKTFASRLATARAMSAMSVTAASDSAGAAKLIQTIFTKSGVQCTVAAKGKNKVLLTAESGMKALFTLADGEVQVKVAGYPSVRQAAESAVEGAEDADLMRKIARSVPRSKVDPAELMEFSSVAVSIFKDQKATATKAANAYKAGDSKTIREFLMVTVGETKALAVAFTRLAKKVR